MKKRTTAFLLQVPAWILILGSFIFSIVFVFQEKISYATPLVILIIIFLYAYGRYLERDTEILKR
jgi:c-di-AMP phosphodiesterase-like protein